MRFCHRHADPETFRSQDRRYVSGFGAGASEEAEENEKESRPSEITKMEGIGTLDRAYTDHHTGLPPEEVIFGASAAMEAVRLSIGVAAGANVPILLQGPSGSGKEILARFIHQCSSWGRGTFVKVNCPAIPGTLFESELFGYQKGAFTGAYASKPGRIELAHRGTLFLDEIAELELGLQAKLLQLLQDGQFCRIGGQQERQVEVRFICATNRQLEKEIKTGTFRQDLFYRINVLAIELPSLQQRICDIPMLGEYFLEKYGRQFNRPAPSLSIRLIQSMQKYAWPGNIRELENIIKRCVITGSEETICSSMENGNRVDFGAELPMDGVIKLKEATRKATKEFEQKIILKTLEANRWNRRATARALSISYAALLYKLREAGVPPRQFATRSKKGYSRVADLTTSPRSRAS
jgi:two-component system, NtrC family, response regulator AtoC